MQQHPQCGVVGCGLKYQDGKFQPSAGFLPNPINTFLWVWGVDVLPGFKQLIPSVHLKSKIKNTQTVGWVMGAAMFMKREVFTDTHGFDEHFFMYLEEVEWCKRVAQAGYQVWYTPEFEIVHLQGASSNYDLSKPLRLEMQGLVYFFKKHYSILAPLMKFAIWGGNLARVLAFTLAGKPERAKVYFQIAQSL